MQRLTIGLDIDNVIYPWSTVFTRWVERRKYLAPGELDDTALSWSWYKHQWGMSTEEMMEHFVAGVQHGVIFHQGEPTPGSLSTVRRLWAAGHTIRYVTDRALPGFDEHEALRVTQSWLARHGFPASSSVYVTGDKASVPTDIFLDDAPHNIDALIAAGHPCPVIWDASHNQHYIPRISRTRALRVASWHEFENLVAHRAGAPAPARLARGTLAA